MDDVLKRNDNFFEVTDLPLHEALLILQLCLEVRLLGLENFDLIVYWAFTSNTLFLFTLDQPFELTEAHV